MSPGTRIYLTLEKHIPPWESWRVIFRKYIFFLRHLNWCGLKGLEFSFFSQISHQRIQVFLDHRDPLHIADLLSHHPLSHIWVPATVTMTTPLKLDRRWLHGPACEKQSDSLLLSLLPFFAPSLLRFVAYLKPSQLLNRLHRKLHLFILFSAPPPPKGSALFRAFSPLRPRPLRQRWWHRKSLYFCGASDGFCSLCSCACACVTQVNCICSNLHISMVTQMLISELLHLFKSILSR